MPLTVFLFLFLLQNPDSVLTQIGIDQKLDSKINPNISFRDDAGQTVNIGDYFGKKPIILTPVYYECPMLCSLALNGLVKTLRAMPLIAGKEFEIVTFSIDPYETPELARAKKEEYVRDYGQSQAQTGWHFLTGTAESIRKLTDQIGFRYAYETYTKQWAHISALVVLTPDGRVSQYFYGIEYDPASLRLSLIQASDEKIGTVVDHVLLYCFRFNSTTGKYSLAIMRVLRVVGLGAVLALVSLVIIGSRKRKEA